MSPSSGNIHRNESELVKMKQQRNMSQMKEQDKNSEEKVSEVEISNLPDKEFRVINHKYAQGTQGKNGKT